jgi:hypothetical protein
MVFLPSFLKDMLGSEEEVQGEVGNPMWGQNDKIVPVLLVHSGEDLMEFLIDQWMIPKIPVE